MIDTGYYVYKTFTNEPYTLHFKNNLNDWIQPNLDHQIKHSTMAQSYKTF